MKHSANQIFFQFLPVLISAAVLLSSCVDDNALRNQMKEVKDRLEDLEDMHIRDLNSQILSMNVSIGDLEAINESLQSLINDLQSEVSLLESQISGSSQSQVSSVSGLLTEIENHKNLIGELERESSKIVTTLDNLRTYVDEELGKSHDWAEKTLASLEEYVEAQGDLSSLSSLIDSIISEKRLEQKYQEVLSKINEEIAASEDAMKSWVNETLAKGYYDIVEIEAKIAELDSLIADGDDVISEEISLLEQELASAKEDLTSAYESAIADAIQTNNGVLNRDMSETIGQALDKLESDLSTIESNVKEIKNKVSDLTDRISSIEEQIAAIDSSLTDLKKFDAQLQKLLDELKEKETALKKRLDETSLSESEERKRLHEEIKEINGLIPGLESKSDSLNQKISYLQTYVDQELSEQSDLVEGSYSTLEQYQFILSELLEIENQIKQENAFYKAASEILQREIGSLRTDMESWVNRILAEGYYMIAQMDGKIGELEALISEGDKNLQDYLETELSKYQDNFKSAKDELDQLCKDAIDDAINKNASFLEGIYRDEIDSFCNHMDEMLESITSELVSIREKVDELEGEVNSIEEQRDAILASIEALKAVDAGMEAYISSLERQLSELQDQLNSDSELNQSDRGEILGQIGEKEELIQALKAKDAELDQKISDLQNYVGSEIETTESWAEATLATIEQYEDLQKDLSEIRTLVLDSTDSKIVEAISKSEESMKGWIQTEHFDVISSTLERLREEFAGLESAAQEGDGELQEELENLSAEIESFVKEIGDQYKDLILDAIRDHHGSITSSRLEDMEDELRAEAANFSREIAGLAERLAKIEENLSKLLEMIQSVTYIPRNFSGCAEVYTPDKTCQLSFRITPYEAVASLESVWSEVLSVKYVNTLLTKSMPVFYDLPISSAEFASDKGIITLILDCSGLDASFYEGTTSANVSLFISSGQNNISSDFIPLRLSSDLSE